VDKYSDASCVRSRRVVASILGVVGGVSILLGLVHFVALPLVLEANRGAGTNLPSCEDTAVGFRLTREPVFYHFQMSGVDRLAFGTILLLCVPALRQGRKLAWRIGAVIGSFLAVGGTALVWALFPRIHPAPLFMPVLGSVVLVSLVLCRRGFTLE
jgi:hypothetical protein